MCIFDSRRVLEIENKTKKGPNNIYNFVLPSITDIMLKSITVIIFGMATIVSVRDAAVGLSGSCLDYTHYEISGHRCCRSDIRRQLQRVHAEYIAYSNTYRI